MKEGDVVLVALPQANGQLKNRPAIALRLMPPFGDMLICGVSTQLHQQVAGFDEIIDPSHADFQLSGIKSASLIRLGFLAVFPVSGIIGKIGYISHDRHRRLLERLAKHIYTAPP
jgi:mRNA interferase MazF